MAVSNNTAWEIRTTGSNLNGGGFVTGATGIDYSQQDAHQYGFSDLVSLNGNSNPATITSASHSFVANDVGNLIRISAGTSWTASWYQIVSIDGLGGAVLDRGCGSIASLSGGVYRVGGAANFSNNTTTDTQFLSAIRGTVHIKSGTYSTAAMAGGVGTLAVYDTARGDNTNNATKAIFNVNGTWTMSTGWIVSNIIAIGFATTVISMSAGTRLSESKIMCNSNGGTAVKMSGSSQLAIINCEVISRIGIGIDLANTSGGVQVLYCYIHDCNIAISCTLAQVPRFIKGCIIESCNTGINYSFASSMIVDSCTIFGSTNRLTVGMVSTVSSTILYLTNTIISGFVTGISASSANSLSYANSNNYFNNTTNRVVELAGIDDVSIDPQFLNVGLITGTNATSTINVLNDALADFSTVTDEICYLNVLSGTGVVVGNYKILSHTGTSLVVDGTQLQLSIGSNISYQITIGRNYAVGTNMQGLGLPKAIGVSTVAYADIGAIQSNGNPGYNSDPGTSNVKNGTTYTIGGTNLTGTLVATSNKSSIG